jgi:hypothetical protein
LPPERIAFVPFNIANHGCFENSYVYTHKLRTHKGANRLCTTLYHYIRRIKFKECATNTNEERQLRARKLYLMADNFSENKNNVVFAFCSHLILLGWFDEIELLFGPVGHTHNGNDSVHHCHNNIAGNVACVTLADFLRNFMVAWQNEQARPQPLYLDSLFDWETFYKPYIRTVKNFTKSK